MISFFNVFDSFQNKQIFSNSFAVIAAIVLAFPYPYFIYEMINPIDSSLQDGDWDTLICYLNCVSTKKPENRPILVIHELINFHPDTPHECPMENAKENHVYFLIILETLDNFRQLVV